MMALEDQTENPSYKAVQAFKGTWVSFWGDRESLDQISTLENLLCWENKLEVGRMRARSVRRLFQSSRREAQTQWWPWGWRGDRLEILRKKN